MSRTSKETAAILADLYNVDFGGKAKGRFKISRKDLTLMAGRSRLQQPIIDDVIDELFEKYDLTMIDLSDEFPIISTSIIRRYRSVPSRLLTKF